MGDLGKALETDGLVDSMARAYSPDYLRADAKIGETVAHALMRDVSERLHALMPCDKNGREIKAGDISSLARCKSETLSAAAMSLKIRGRSKSNGAALTDRGNTMISDRERRRVAARLRMHDTMEPPWLELESCIGVHPEDASGVFVRLADLIDRPTCSMTHQPHKNEDGKTRLRPTCSNCGQAFIAASFFDGTADPVGFSYCPTCGAEVVRHE